MTDWIQAICAIISTIFAITIGIITVVIAKKELHKINEQIRSAKLVNSLTIESDISNKKERIESFYRDMKGCLDDANNSVYEKVYKAYIENYLNALDRFCHLILSGDIEIERWEYYNYIAGIVKTYGKVVDFLNDYPDIAKLYSKWKGG